MRIGVVARSLDPVEGGGFTFVDAVMRAVASAATSHEFIVYRPPPAVPEAPRWRRQVRRVTHAVARRLRPPKRGPEGQGESPLDAFVRDARIDVVWFVEPGGVGRSMPSSAPFITTVWDLAHRIHPYFPEVSTSGWRWEDRERHYLSTLPRASRIVTGTEAGKKEIVEFYRVNPDNVVVVPMPLAEIGATDGAAGASDMKARHGIERPFLFYPAQFWPHKNHANLLLALDLLRRDGIDFDLVLTGGDKGNRAHVLKMATELDLSSRLHLLGFVPRAEIIALYQQAFCLVFPSFFGPDNIPPLEAFALGCPVVAARVSGAEEQLGDAALLFDPRDPTDMARALGTLQSDEALRSTLVERGREIVAERTATHYLARIASMLDEFESVRRCWGQSFIYQ